MKIQCPGCGYAADMNETLVPLNGLTIECPKCKLRLKVRRGSAPSQPLMIESAGPGTQRAPTTEPRQTPKPPEKPPASLKNETATARVNTGPGPSTLKPKGADSNAFSFHGTGGGLFGIYIVNYFLNLLTFGLYRFWGKVKLRAYIYSQTELMGERFAYHGDGRELFIGWLKGAGILWAALAVIIALSYLLSAYLLILIPVSLPALITFAIVGTMRYRINHTSWRGVRLSFRGSFKEAFLLYTFGIFILIFTLGLYFPFFHANTRRYWLVNTFYGDRHLEYSGKGTEIIKTMLLPGILTAITGVYIFWYVAKLNRYDWGHTKFSGAGFRSTVTGAGLLGLMSFNLLIYIFTLFLGYPWALARTLRYKLTRLSVAGSIDFEKIKQDAKQAKTTGEGIADAFSLDVDMG